MRRQSQATCHLAALLLSAWLVSGCGTIIGTTGRQMPQEYRRGMPTCYPGVAVDSAILAETFSPDADDRGMLACMAPFALIDIPISLVVDTLMLPFDLARHRRDQRQE